MNTIQIFDKPMCCSTGVCGPDGEDKLAQFASTLDWVKKNGHQVERYDLGHAPGAFASNAFVRTMIEKEGMSVLPLVLVDGEVNNTPASYDGTKGFMNDFSYIPEDSFQRALTRARRAAID